MAEERPEYQRGMVVVAHADDAEWGCSGTVAKWCAQGWEVVYVLCTDGSKGTDDPELTKILYLVPNHFDHFFSNSNTLVD